MLGGFLPQRRADFDALKIPALDSLKSFFSGTGKREISTTMAFVRLLSTLIKDTAIGERIVPIIPDEARTFGMEGMFRQLGIYSSEGQLYQPADADQVMYYKEDVDGQVLEEGINEGGAFAAWLAAATSYSNNSYTLIPFYVFYSMFGFQRIGDLCWAAGDLQARGFLMGGTAGRTTLNGEGLQHQDGHSHILASTIPNCVCYDPAFAYELAVIIHTGMEQMFVRKEARYYYITLMNENYPHPQMPEGVVNGIIKGMYLLQKTSQEQANAPKVQLLGSGTILREVLAASIILQTDFDVLADVWSVTSFNELRKDGLSTNRWNMLNPQSTQKKSYVTKCLEETEGPVIASSDYIKIYADQIREFVPRTYKVLGTDGFGRSDSREKLRHFFEVDRYFIVLLALRALADEGTVPITVVTKALQMFEIVTDRADPTLS